MGVAQRELAPRALVDCPAAALEAAGGDTQECDPVTVPRIAVRLDLEDVGGERRVGQGSLGNGAAMRIAPVAVRYVADPDLLVQEAVRSAALTHSHPLGIDAALVQAAAVAAAMRDEDPIAGARRAAQTDVLRDLLDRAAALGRERSTPVAVAESLGNSSSGHESVPAAVYAASVHESFEEAVTFAIACGGDTDTIGAMAGAVAGARLGASAIPARWLAELEDGDRGHRHVADLALGVHRQSAIGAV